MQSIPTMDQGFTGTVNLQLTDLIQMVCLSRSDMVIRVQCAVGTGAIAVGEGNVLDAQVGTLGGESAFFEILRWKDGRFEMGPLSETLDRSIDKPWEHLLLEAMRLRDEEAIEHNGTILTEFEEDIAKEASPEEMDERIDRAFDEMEWMAELFPGSGDPPAVDVHEAPAAPLAMDSKVKVLIVDDSTFFIRRLKQMLEADAAIEVVGTARNGKEALDFLDTHPPVDLIMLDVQMPVMRGDTAFKHIMIRHPIPVLIISAFQPETLGKLFELLQGGAVDFVLKPDAKEDAAAYGERLCDLVKRVARSDVTRFRRRRKTNGNVQAVQEAVATDSTGNILVLLGAEGAYMDWFRLPLRSLCRHGLVVGFQRLPDLFLPGFCRLIEEATAAKTRPLDSTKTLTPGVFHLGNARHPIDLKLLEGAGGLCVENILPESVPWLDGVAQWLGRLAMQGRDRLSVCCLSAAQPLPSALIETLIACKTRLILSPQETLICPALVESVWPYALLYPDQVLTIGPESLMEVWLEHELAL